MTLFACAAAGGASAACRQRDTQSKQQQKAEYERYVDERNQGRGGREADDDAGAQVGENPLALGDGAR